MASWTQRMIGAAKLDAATFEEVEADTTATTQAMGVVLLSAAAAGIGEIGYGGRGLIVGVAGAMIGWLIWAFLTWLIGTKFLPEVDTKADVGQLLRTIGFAASPGFIRVFGWIPILGTVIEFVAWIWMLAAMVVAVRQALDYKSTGKAILVCAIGWFVNVIIFVSLASLVGIAAMSIGGAGGR